MRGWYFATFKKNSFFEVNNDCLMRKQRPRAVGSFFFVMFVLLYGISLRRMKQKTTVLLVTKLSKISSRRNSRCKENKDIKEMVL